MVLDVERSDPEKADGKSGRGSRFASRPGRAALRLGGAACDSADFGIAMPFMSDSKRRQALVETQRDRGYPQGKTVHGLFEEQAERAPDAVAVVFGEMRLTYRQLNERANRLARYLGKQGVGPEVLVGLCVERSLDTVVGILGILKAGGAYVPLDPGYPRQRVE